MRVLEKEEPGHLDVLDEGNSDKFPAFSIPTGKSRDRADKMKAITRMRRNGAFLLVLSVLGTILVVRQHCWSDNCTNDHPSPAGIEEYSMIYQVDQLAYANQFNLLTEAKAQEWEAKLAAGTAECTLEYANANRLAQDHPCVLQLIRTRFIRSPPPHDEPYSFSNITECSPEWNVSTIFDPQGDPSMGQTALALTLLKNQTEGFFVECGAYDGQTMSNTLYLERTLGWSGLLIEASPPFFEQLSLRKRKAWTMPVCLSLVPYPTEVSFQLVRGVESVAAHIVDPTEKLWDKPGVENVTVQCFPFYSILLAVNRNRVDFFSLDIEGHELKVLRTIPFEKVDIRVLSAEWRWLPGEGAKDVLIRFMEENGFIKYAEVYLDIMFFKDTFNDLHRRTKSGRPLGRR